MRSSVHNLGDCVSRKQLDQLFTTFESTPPVFDQPVFDQPVFDQPVFDQPVFDQLRDLTCLLMVGLS